MVKKNIDIEDLLAQIEQKITDNEYYEDVSVEYKDLLVNVRIRPITQAKFTQISKNQRVLQSAEFNTEVIHACVLNKHDNKPFTKDQINQLFTGGLAAVLAIKCCEISGIETDTSELKKLLDF